MKIDDYYFGNLKPTTLKDKELFLNASLDIQHSFTGRLDMLEAGLHRFFIESSIMARNAVRLFEEGFFDAAFYSIRSSLELARIVTYFSNESNPRESSLYRDWALGGRFPMDSSIRSELDKSSDVYQELRDLLPDFFDAQAKRLKKSQKYIHKQGYKTFYERGFTGKDREDVRLEAITKDFADFTKNSIAEIALLRLCIDPFPLLLKDPNVMYKIHSESMTEAFSDDIINKIIGKDKINLYYTTEIYRSHVQYYEDNESLSEEAHTLVNDQYYDRNYRSIIERQLHLLSNTDKLAVNIFNTSRKISKVYFYGGLLFYFSDVKTTRRKLGFNSEDLDKVKEAGKKINLPYGEAYLSYIALGEEEVWLEHNSRLGIKELAKINDG